MGKTTSGMGRVEPRGWMGRRTRGDLCVSFWVLLDAKFPPPLLFFPLPFSGLVFSEPEPAKGLSTIPLHFYFRRVVDFSSVQELFQWEPGRSGVPHPHPRSPPGHFLYFPFSLLCVRACRSLSVTHMYKYNCLKSPSGL